MSGYIYLVFLFTYDDPGIPILFNRKGLRAKQPSDMLGSASFLEMSNV